MKTVLVYVAFASLLIGLVVLFAPKEGTQNRPVTFSDVPFGQVRFVSLPIRNNTAKEWIFDRVESTCGCIVVAQWPKSLAPSSESSIHLEIHNAAIKGSGDLHRLQPTLQEVHAVLQSGELLVWRLSGILLPPALAEPSLVSISLAPDEDHFAATAQLILFSSSPGSLSLEVDELASAWEGIEGRIVRIEPPTVHADFAVFAVTVSGLLPYETDSAQARVAFRQSGNGGIEEPKQSVAFDLDVARRGHLTLMPQRVVILVSSEGGRGQVAIRSKPEDSIDLICEVYPADAFTATLNKEAGIIDIVLPWAVAPRATLVVRAVDRAQRVVAESAVDVISTSGGR